MTTTVFELGSSKNDNLL